MGTILKENELNQLSKGTVLFRKGEQASSIGMIVKGSIQLITNGMKRIAKKNEIIGIADVFQNAYMADYIVEEDTVLYAFPALTTSSLEAFLNSNIDYRGILIHSVETELIQYMQERQNLLQRVVELYAYLKDHYEIALREGMTEEVPVEFLDVLPEDVLKLECNDLKISYYEECEKMPQEIHDEFFCNSGIITLYHAAEISNIIDEVISSGGEILSYMEDIYGMYWNKEGDNLFDKEVRFAKEMKKNGKFEMNHLIRVNDTKNKICMMNELITQYAGKALYLDKNYLEEQIASIMNASLVDNEEVSAEKAEEKPQAKVEKPKTDPMVELKHSLPQILQFADIAAEEQKEMIAVINAFVNAKDRMSTQDDMRRLKKQIALYYFKLYKICVFKWFENEDVPLAVRLFLNYSYIDERLLEKEQIQVLCDKIDARYDNLACNIYTMPEWLKEIYEGRKDTSRNSFEQDYRDYLREQKRTGRITEAQEREYIQDPRRKVMFEIDNMFTSNQKIVNGKLSTYVPILYEDEIYGDLERLYLTKQKLSDTILELEKKDFTIFYREVLYTNPGLKIDKEYVTKHVYPDVIIAPVYGAASSMWQEITGKKRDTPARFIFPAISEEEIYKLVTKAFGRFHWEYCRCEQGTSWNNIQYKSLTSEYMDYIQYYRKNHDISEKGREKIKLQIQRARNNSREIFLSDYEMWIYSESRSAMKLNKVARVILATYCPFNKEIRESLSNNAAFAEAMMRQKRRFAEKAKEWDLRIKRRENNGLEVPPEFYSTYQYYADR